MPKLIKSLLLITALSLSVSYAVAENKITGSELIGGSYTLVNQRNEIVTNESFHGTYQLVFLGFTNCAHFCPLGLHAMVKTLEALKDDAEKIQPIFITIDPSRDTAERLSTFLPGYHKRFIGLTGTQQQVDQAVKAFRGYSRKMNTKNGYTFDHSTVIYFLGPNGEFINYFSSSINPEEIAEQIRKSFKN
ncbi:MAG: SCO family protein [Bdellovibrionota bacterium]